MKQKNNKNKTDNEIKAGTPTETTAESVNQEPFYKLDKEQLQKYVLALIQENEYLIAQNSEFEEKAAEAEARAADTYGKLVTIKGDFERLKARSKDVAEESEQRGRCNAIECIFPVLDTFDRARVSASDDVLAALTPITKQFEAVLRELSIEEIDILNKPFDPQLASAVLEMPAEGEEEKDTVCAIVSKGYMYKDKILRYPKVVVKT